MRGALLVSMAFLPGLCEKAENPSEGVPPVVWQLRQVMEKEVTKDAKGEYVTPEQAERFRDAADEVATFANVRDTDVGAEVVYLLPRSWQWPQRECLRDLIVLLGCGPGTQVLQAEDNQSAGTGFRKAVYGYLFGKKNGLHTQITAMSAEDRVDAVLKAANAGDFGNPKFGWQAGQNLAWEYGAMVLAGHPAESVPKLEKLASEAGPLRTWALTTLARMDDARADEALKSFYSAGDEPAGDDERALAAAFRFWSIQPTWGTPLEYAVLVPGARFALHPLQGTAVAVDRTGWDSRGEDAGGVKLGMDSEPLGRKGLVQDGDRASVLVTEVVSDGDRKSHGAPVTENAFHFRLRKRGGIWVVTRWSRKGP